MRTIGALLYPGFELLDMFGPMEMFGILPKFYKLHLVAEDLGPIASAQGLSAHATRTIDGGEKYDILFVPGGIGTIPALENQKLLDWITKTSQTAEYTMSVCTGSALLAKAGVLDGRKATTNKAYFSQFAEHGKNVDWQRRARWVEDGPVFTSSGVSAGMDMALGAIAAMHGRDMAVQAANASEYTWHEDRDHDPFAELHGLV